MGASASSLLIEEIEEIAQSTKLTHDEVRNLYLRFLRLDKKQSGRLTSDALMMIPELAMNPLAPRLTSIFAEVNFRQFVELLSVFGKHADPLLKRDFLFRVYDIDGDNYVSKEDLIHVLQLLLGEYTDAESVARIADDIVTHADHDGDGLISKDEFEQVVDIAHIQRRATVAL